MRLQTVLLGCGLLLSSVTMAQSVNGTKQLKGKIEMKQLISDSAFAWFYTGVNKYEANTNMVNYIKSNKDKIQLVALVNTTDDASKKLLPALYKVTILSSIPEESMHLYGTDNSGNTGDQVGDSYKVKRTPTVLVMLDGKEVGRVSGSPKQAIEEELAQILMKMNSKK